MSLKRIPVAVNVNDGIEKGRSENPAGLTVFTNDPGSEIDYFARGANTFLYITFWPPSTT